MKNRREKSDKIGPTSDFDKGLSFGIGKRKSKKEKKNKKLLKISSLLPRNNFFINRTKNFLF